MAHESKGPPASIMELGQLAKEAHAEQHGTMKANENLPGLPQESRRAQMERAAAEQAAAPKAETVETDAEGNVVKAKAKAQTKAQASAEDK